MKKVIVSILALACGVCAYAKTLDELLEGMPEAEDWTTSQNWNARRAYAEQNYEDFAREFAAYQEALDIEAALRSRGGNNADAITSLKAVVEVEDFLYLKFTRSTKIK